MPIRLAARKIQIQYTSESPPILSQFSLELETGSFVGIVGPNGSGKSTLIRALSRALKPAQGVVLLNERDLYHTHSARSSARLIGVVPQDTAVSLGFSVREVVAMGRASHLPTRPFASETPADKQVVSEALLAARVDDLAERSVTTLSGGERQRVLFARALAQQPDVLLLDEPTSSLDLRHQAETLSLARDLAHTDGKAVLAVLHDVNLAAAYCDQLVLLNHGAIVAQGTPADVLTAENLQAVYGVRAWVRPHPASGRPLVLPLPEMPSETPARLLPAVHIICGGGTGAPLMVALHRLGYPLTAGGLNAGDADADAAQMLQIPFALESAFSLLTYAVLEKAALLARTADFVLLTDVPFGRVNLANLEAALMLRRAGKFVLCLQNPASSFSARNFAGRAAQGLWTALLTAGAVVLPDIAAVLEYLQRWEGHN
ncbi:MAG: heme ABC transporter ATP-binding protein [Janthinobacterium lividum]